MSSWKCLHLYSWATSRVRIGKTKKYANDLGIKYEIIKIKLVQNGIVEECSNSRQISKAREDKNTISCHISFVEEGGASWRRTIVQF